jgi:hypothetical protein
MSQIKELLAMKLAWLLPRRLVMWCAVRVGAHATTGPYGNQIVSDLTFMDALGRWDALPPEEQKPGDVKGGV